MKQTNKKNAKKTTGFVFLSEKSFPSQIIFLGKGSLQIVIVWKISTAFLLRVVIVILGEWGSGRMVSFLIVSFFLTKKKPLQQINFIKQG